MNCDALMGQRGEQSSQNVLTSWPLDRLEPDYKSGRISGISTLIMNKKALWTDGKWLWLIWQSGCFWHEKSIASNTFIIKICNEHLFTVNCIEKMKIKKLWMGEYKKAVADVINIFQSSIDMLCFNEALWLAFASHMTSLTEAKSRDLYI